MKHLLLLVALLSFSAAGAQKIEKQTDIYAIKGVDTLRMDRYVVADETKADKPCMLFVFGGGFYTGTRDNSTYLPYFEYYARRGFVVASIDYRLGLKRAAEMKEFDANAFAALFIGALTMASEDLYDATAYVLANAKAWGVDTQQIVASGSSAGAITVLMGEYGICNGSALARNLPKEFNYAGIISYAGAIFAMGDELTWSKNPAPMMLFHGDLDRNVPYGELAYEGAGFFGSKAIADQLSARRVPHYFYSVANTDHAMATRPMLENRYEIDAFLEKLVFGRQPLVIDTYVTPTDKPAAPKNFTIIDFIQANFPQ